MGVLWKVEGVGVIEEEEERLLIAANRQLAAVVSEDVVVVHSLRWTRLDSTRRR